MYSRLLILLFWLFACPAGAVTPAERICALGASAYLLEDDAGRGLADCRAGKPQVPASTLKLLTAWLALEYWGEDFRFSTDFFIDGDQTLYVVGHGDPMLVSEELDSMAGRLVAAGAERLRDIVIDDHWFAPGIEIPGRAASDNPYDAPVAALAVNFNTVHLLKRRGRLGSAEPQTPLTPTARRLGAKLPEGKHRIRLPDGIDAGLYFAEVLRAKLQAHGIQVSGGLRRGQPPDGARRILRHRNSHPLSEVVRAMLRYSNNFIANQLLLALGADVAGPPADMEKALAYARQRIDTAFGWRDYRIVEGAGLSRDNRLSAAQLVMLLRTFAPWADLLPERRPGIRAKTGTLDGIRTLAGYIERDDRLFPFAILINAHAPSRLRFDLAMHWRASLVRSER